jgi:hypothetical protein
VLGCIGVVTTESALIKWAGEKLVGPGYQRILNVFSKAAPPEVVQQQ